MPRKLSRKLSAAVLCLLMVPGTQVLFGQNGCYTPWATKTILWYTTAKPGLIAFNGKLILAWGDKTTNALNTSYSTDGVNWSAPSVWTSFPLVKPEIPDSYNNPPPTYQWSGGVNMTVASSTTCPSSSTGYVYIG